MRNRSYRDLVAWQRAMDLVESVYRATDSFPKSEDYALKSQMRRSAVAIPSNIAEGSARGTDKDHVQFLRIALGSIRELDTQVEIGRRVGYLTESGESELHEAIGAVERPLFGLIASFEK
jgi:four helix bundle protein